MDPLLELLRTHSYRSGPVTLSSGQVSHFFVDCKQTVLRAQGHLLVADRMLAALNQLPRSAVAVAGVELGGCPLASAVSLRSAQIGRELDAVYVRKAVKEHGSKRRLEGDGHLQDAAPIAILEDVITTGGSTLRAAEALRERGLDVVGVVTLVDREEGGREALDQGGLHMVALYRRGDFE